MRRHICIFLILLTITSAVISSCAAEEARPETVLHSSPSAETEARPDGRQTESAAGKRQSYMVDTAGATIRERFPAPSGFLRIESGDYGEFLRNQELLPDQSPVLLYDGTKKANQSAHAAVLAVDAGKNDLQQCADAALRLRAEFFYARKEYGRISFHLTNGFLFPYQKYAEGYRLKVEGSKTSLHKNATEDYSYECFRKYLNILFAYAGTLSVEAESTPVEKKDLQIGDIFIAGGSPGHCVIVADLCENPETGERAFLLMQSYMPAQQIHILKNPLYGDSPWYLLSELSYPFKTPQWTFERECLRRMP